MKIELSQKYKQLVINIGLFAINTVATKFVTFLLVPLYTHYLSAEEYGVIDMSLTVISLITPLATLSVADAAVRFIVGDGKRGSEYAFVSFAVTLLSILIVLMLMPLLNFKVFGGLGLYKYAFVTAYASSALLQLCGEVARGVGKVRLVAICSAISSFITCSIAFILISCKGMRVIGYFISISLGPLVSITIYLTLGGLGKLVFDGAQRVFNDNNQWDRLVKLCSPMLRYSLPLIPNSLFWWIGTSINRFFISSMLGIASSGMFAAASKLPNLLNVTYSVFQQAWQLSVFQESGEGNLNRYFSQIFGILQAVMTILCALLSFLAPWLSLIFLQGEFYGAWPMLANLLIANLANVFNAFYGTIYTTTMQTTYNMKTTLYGAAICMLLTPALIVPFGVFGASIASVAGNILVFALRAYDSRKYIKFYVGWKFLVPTFIILVLQAAVTAIQVPGWQAVSCACLVACVIIQTSSLILRKHK